MNICLVRHFIIFYCCMSKMNRKRKKCMHLILLIVCCHNIDIVKYTSAIFPRSLNSLHSREQCCKCHYFYAYRSVKRTYKSSVTITKLDRGSISFSSAIRGGFIFTHDEDDCYNICNFFNTMPIFTCRI